MKLLFLILVVFGIIIFIQNKTEEKEKIKKDLEKKAQEKKKEYNIKLLTQSGLVGAVHQQMFIEVIKQIERTINNEIDRFPYKPEFSSVWKDINHNFTVNSDCITCHSVCIY